MIPSFAMQRSLYQVLGIGEGDTVSVTGGGGKTTLVFHLAGELAGTSDRVLVTTTTHMYYPGDFSGRIMIDEDEDAVVRAFNAERLGQMFAAARNEQDHKVAGYSIWKADRMSRRLKDAIFLVEADGAARKPYKFYRDDEPVLPKTTTHIVHVVGAEVLDAKMSNVLFHRCPERYEGYIFDLHRFEEGMEWFASRKLAGFRGCKTLLVTKADSGREAAALAMCEAAKPYFDECHAVSFKRGTWL